MLELDDRSLEWGLEATQSHRLASDERRQSLQGLDVRTKSIDAFRGLSGVPLT